MVSPSSVSVMRVPSGLERVSVRLAVPGSSGMKLAGSSIVAVSIAVSVKQVGLAVHLEAAVFQRLKSSDRHACEGYLRRGFVAL